MNADNFIVYIDTPNRKLTECIDLVYDIFNKNEVKVVPDGDLVAAEIFDNDTKVKIIILPYSSTALINFCYVSVRSHLVVTGASSTADRVKDLAKNQNYHIMRVMDNDYATLAVRAISFIQQKVLLPNTVQFLNHNI